MPQQNEKISHDVLQTCEILKVELPTNKGLMPRVYLAIPMLVADGSKDKFDPATMVPGKYISGYISVKLGQTSGKPYLRMTGPRIKEPKADQE